MDEGASERARARERDILFAWGGWILSLLVDGARVYSPRRRPTDPPTRNLFHQEESSEAAPIKSAIRESVGRPTDSHIESAGKLTDSLTASATKPADSLPSHFIGAASGA